MTEWSENLYIGAVVRSIAGRDKNRELLVIGTRDGGRYPALVVADGRRKGAGARLKNPRHVKVLARITEGQWQALAAAPEDETVRQILSAYDGRITVGVRPGAPAAGEDPAIKNREDRLYAEG